MNETTVRLGARDDLPAINAIYNHYVGATHFTFDIDPIGIEERQEWFTHYHAAGRHRLFVALTADRVVGYTTSSRYRPKAAYDTSVETTVYLDPRFTGRGIGFLLYTALMDAIALDDVHMAYAGIAIPNPASVALHERFGFHQAGYFREQGRKHGRYWDVAWFEKSLAKTATEAPGSA
jgi:phosphinothricin acetyltransferase